MRYLSLILLLFFNFIFQTVWSQNNVRDSSVFIALIRAGGVVQLPVADMAKRFGLGYSVGGGFTIKSKKNWLFGAEGNFMTGDNVKEPGLLQNMIAPTGGGVIAQDGGFADLNVYYRGWNAMAHFGKLLPLFGPNKNSGLVLMLGMGYLQHKIRLEVRGNNAQQLFGDYVNGYDRLTGGLAISQFIGYMQVSNNRRINFYVGFEFHQAFTKSFRGLNYDTGEVDDKGRLDGLVGFKAGWMFPIFAKKATDYYYK